MLVLSLLLLTTIADGPDPEADLARALRHYAEGVDATWDPTAADVAWLDLNRDGLDDAIVFVTDDDWCNRSGCTVLVFEAMPPEDAVEMGPFRPAAEIRHARQPVHVAPSTRGVWSDLFMRDRDGAVRQLSFNGESYPLTPAHGRPARSAPVRGVALFADAPSDRRTRAESTR